jgi:hypothetical protein
MYGQQVPRRASRDYYYTHQTEALQETPVKSREKVFRRPFKRYLFLGFLLVLVIYFGWMRIVKPFVDSVEMQWHYGDIPTYHLDADVGHGGVSHFLSFIWHGEILVVEVNPKYEVHLYRCGSLIVDESQKLVIAMDVADVNNDGKPDLLVHVQGQRASIVLLNTGTGFVVQGS